MIIREPAPEPIKRPATCHPDRELRARGLCAACVEKARRAQIPRKAPNATGRGGYAHQYGNRLYALARLVWDEVHKLDGPRSESAIAGWLADMQRILDNRQRLEDKRLRRRDARSMGVARDDRDRADLPIPESLEGRPAAAAPCAAV